MKRIMKVLIVLLIVFILSGCNDEKTKLSAENFTKKMSNLGFVVSDNTKLIEDSTIKSAFAAHNGKYQIEYYIFENEKRAEEAYNSNKEYFENNGKNGKVKKHETYTKYVQELSDTYNVLTKVDNTLLYASINIEYKKEIKKILKELNY